MSKAIYPGTFDPFTLGHLDIVERACTCFDEVIILLATNDRKTPLLDTDKRRAAIEKSVAHLSQVSVAQTTDLVVEFAKAASANVLVRGCRNATDIESELQLCEMNRQLAPEIETVFLAPSATFQQLSSSIVREILQLNKDPSLFLPKAIADAYLGK